MHKGLQKKLIVEIIGPAGSGKSTLFSALKKFNPNMQAGFSTHSISALPYYLKSGIKLLPTLTRVRKAGFRFSWPEIKTMLYVTSLHSMLKGQPKDEEMILLDQGPVFSLAWLNAFVFKKSRSQLVEPWWFSTIESWGQTLDYIVWLDAPNSILIDRVNGRDSWHNMKKMTVQEMEQFLESYRDAYQRTLAGLKNSPVKILKFDTGQTPVNEILERMFSDEALVNLSNKGPEVKINGQLEEVN